MKTWRIELMDRTIKYLQKANADLLWAWQNCGDSEVRDEVRRRIADAYLFTDEALGDLQSAAEERDRDE